MKEIQLISVTDLKNVIGECEDNIMLMLEAETVHAVDDIILLTKKQAFDVTYQLGAYTKFPLLGTCFVETAEQGNNTFPLSITELCSYINNNTSRYQKLTPSVLSRWMVNRHYLNKTNPRKCPTHMIEGNRHNWFTEDYKVNASGARIILARVIKDNESGYIKGFFE